MLNGHNKTNQSFLTAGHGKIIHVGDRRVVLSGRRKLGIHLPTDDILKGESFVHEYICVNMSIWEMKQVWSLIRGKRCQAFSKFRHS